MTSGFIFATGIENSIPKVGDHRVDEMAKCGHYDQWRRDFECVQEIGCRFLRYGPPLHTTWRGEGRYDWAFADQTFAELKRLGIVPIVDLCHFGVPDWVGDFQNPDFPASSRPTPTPSPTASLGAALHARERDVHLRHLLRPPGLVERAAQGRRELRHRASSTS
jgi:hypothetical protein